MKHRPILFSTEMVCAIIDGRKTQTRRIKFKCDVGDILWVRETWKKCDGGYMYKTDKYFPPVMRWKPAIFMPREACRLFLRVEAVREERLRDITPADLAAEGIAYTDDANEDRGQFIHLWDGINAKRGYGWDANPIVRVITFSRMEL